jgi:hypothetical protein
VPRADATFRPETRALFRRLRADGSPPALWLLRLLRDGERPAAASPPPEAAAPPAPRVKRRRKADKKGSK